MRDSDRFGRRMVSRVKGRPALERRLRGVLIAVHRFGRQLAHTTDEIGWRSQ